MKFFLILFSVFIGCTLAQDQLGECRAELQRVHNQATLEIKNLTDLIEEYINNAGQNATLGDMLKQKMKDTATDIKNKWNTATEKVKEVFSELGGTISNTWESIFGQTTTAAPEVRPGVTIPTTDTPVNFWDKVRSFFG